MRILFLGPSDSPLLSLFDDGDAITRTNLPLTLDLLDAIDPEWTVSYGYRHLLQGKILDRVKDHAINLHVSLLPWNRGADPNLWSFIDNTPKGVSIHYIDKGIDTGDLIARMLVQPEAGDTLRTSYERLHTAIQTMFLVRWPDIRTGTAKRYRQPAGGSYHSTADRARIELPDGWDTPVASLRAGVQSRGMAGVIR